MAEKVGLIAVLDLRQFNRAYNDYINKLGAMNSTTDRTASSLSGQFLGLGNALLGIAGILTGAVVAAVGAAAVAFGKFAVTGIKEAADLEQQIANIASTMNLTKDEAGFLNDVIIDLGLDPRLRVTTFEAAEAMDLLAKNGIFAGQSVQQMEQTARDAGTAVVLLANATGAEFGQAANIATDAMAIFGMKAEDLVDIVSGITSVTTNSKFTINDYEVALRNGGAAAATMGLSLQDFNTMIAASAEELGTGMKAGTGMLNFMNRLTPNTNKATEAMKDLGLITADGNNRFFDMNGELKSGAEIAQILNQALYGTTKVMGEVGGRTAEQNQLLAELNAEYSAAQQTIDNYTSGVDGLLASEEEKNAAISEAQAIMEKLAPTMAELNGIQGELIETTQTLSTEQRSMALETIFGNDALKTALAVALEGQMVYGRLDEVVAAFGVSYQEASRMVEEGLTEFELMQQQMSKTDAIENAETRMDTLKGKIEILGGIFEAVRIRFGEPFVELFGRLAEKAIGFIEQQDGVMEMVGNFADSLSGLVENLINGEKPLDSFVTFLEDIGRADLGDQLLSMVDGVEKFVTPIIDFVTTHQDAFIGGLKALGALLASAAIASALAAIGSVLALIVSPLGALTLAVITLGAAWSSNWMDIQGITKNVVSKISQLLDDIGVTEFIDTLKEAFGEGGFKGVVEAIPDALSALGSDIQSAFMNWFESVDWNQIGINIITSIFEAMSTAGTMAGDAINMFVNWVGSVDWEQVGGQIVDALLSAIGVILALNALQFQALFKFFEALITNVDWVALGETMWGFIRDLNVGAYSRLIEVSGELGELFKTGVLDPTVEKIKEAKDEFVQAAQESIAQGIITAIEWLSENILEPLGQFFQSIWDWFTSITWEDLGYWLTTAILTVLFGFPAQVLETLTTWWEAFFNWFTTTDWESLVDNQLVRINAVLLAFPVIIAATLINWWTAFTTWFTEKDWEGETGKSLNRIDTILKTMPALILLTLATWWTTITTWFTEKDWSSLGTDIINGVIDGLNAGAARIGEALRNLADGAFQAWKDYWGIESPSKLMIQSSGFIMEGAELGAESKATDLATTLANVGAQAFSAFNETANLLLPNSPTRGNTISNSNQTTNNYEVNNSFLDQPQITDDVGLRTALAGFG